MGEGGYARLNRLERRFLDQSVQERGEEETRTTRAAHRLKWLRIGASIAAVFAMAGGVFAVFQVRKAESCESKAVRQFNLALAAQSLAIQTTRPQRALLLAVEADARENEMGRTGVAPEKALRNAIRNLGGIRLGGHQGGVPALAISPDNHWLVTGSDDATARLWDLTAPGPGRTAVELTGHDGPVSALAISPDNHWLVTGGEDCTARLWNLRLEELLPDARRAAGRNFTQKEWKEHFPEEPYRKTFPELPEGK